jgi:PilZ domain
VGKAKDSVRRRAPRVPIRLDGSLAGRTPRGVTVVDLSLTGCLVKCDTLHDHGAILDLRLDLGPEPFVAKVQVTEA